MRFLIPFALCLFPVMSQALNAKLITKLDGPDKPIAAVYLADQVTDSAFGVSSFFVVAGGYAEAYVGPTWSPTKWFGLELSLGVEQTDQGLGLRTALGAWFSQKPWSSLGTVEWSPMTGDVWYDVSGLYAVSERIGVGVRVRRFVGTGPLVDFSLPKLPLEIWASWNPLNQETGELTPNRWLVGIALKL